MEIFTSITAVKHIVLYKVTDPKVLGFRTWETIKQYLGRVLHDLQRTKQLDLHEPGKARASEPQDLRTRDLHHE